MGFRVARPPNNAGPHGPICGGWDKAPAAVPSRGPATHPEPQDETQEQTHASADLDVLLAGLRVEEREALHLNAVEGYTAREIATSSFAAIQTALPHLAFPIAPTQPEMLAGMRMIGRRYCSILDELAAQISLVGADGQPCTLYVAPLTPPMSKINPGIHRIENGTVQIWTDAHRVFALAR